MEDNRMLQYIKEVLNKMPEDWLSLTTHRLDIYNEELAKTQFLEQFEVLYRENNADPTALNELPTAFDYIRLGHPLSCLLEWAVGQLNNIKPNNVISFSSKTIAILAVLRKNLFAKKKTQVLYTGNAPELNVKLLKEIYGYQLDFRQIEQVNDIPEFEGSTIFISKEDEIKNYELSSNIDFFISLHDQLGSILLVNGEENEDYISEIQHVRRRETIAMTPANALSALKGLVDKSVVILNDTKVASNKVMVLDLIQEISGTKTKALVGSSGLSIQYAILMGLVHQALEQHQGKEIKIVVPTNCYGGTNDQARRVAACLDMVEVVDLAVDGGSDMVQSIEVILDKIAKEDAVPFIIAEIPTNPRVEVPELIKLQEVLSRVRHTKAGEISVDPVFILDQTFCPNVHFLGAGEILSTVRTISFASGSKFPSGGMCTAGYCIGNAKAEALMEKVELHLQICDNEATDLQLEILAKQMPSMLQRIQEAYRNTREFVNFINLTLPEAKINFVSEELAKQGFTPSVFSLDLPTKGSTDEEREAYKRALNNRLINLMITEIPKQSKYCVSYGQLKGCYWTIPATSTQGTTKEGDKDYIARVALSPDLDLERHKQVFKSFVNSI